MVFIPTFAGAISPSGSTKYDLRVRLPPPIRLSETDNSPLFTKPRGWY
jgi:hypothetical protein